MQLRKLKLRFRRQLRRGQHQVEDLGLQAEAQLEQLFFKRVGRLVPVWRFIVGWMALWILIGIFLVAQIIGLSNDYQTLKPVPGGTFTEGMVGSFTNANPIYATSDVDSTMSHLLFAGLLSYNDQNQLVGNLAQSWSADSTGMVYTVKLKPDLKWQDGKPLTANDVVFTFRTIQNPDAESPFYTSWQGVSVTSSGPLTVIFSLPNPLSSFPDSLTLGILPEHVLSKIAPDDLRSSLFNTQTPLGAGPFKLATIEVNNSAADSTETQLEMIPNPYFNGGVPKLTSFVLDAFADQQFMISQFDKHDLTAMAGLSNVPRSLAANDSIHEYSPLLTAAKMVFFNTTDGALASAQVRQALVEAADPSAIIAKLGYSTVAVKEPLLVGQLGYNPKYQQATNQLPQAESLLSNAGWVMGPGGVRYKSGQPLTFGLYSLNDSEDNMVASTLKAEWEKLGVRLNIESENSSDFSDTVATRTYDALLYGISIGVDPDVFVYWDSSQSHSIGGQNYSLYDSPTADISLEAGRTRLDPALRTIKYQNFLAAWQQDNPALGLYQPRYLVVSWPQIYGLNAKVINTNADLLSDIQNWEILQAKVTD